MRVELPPIIGQYEVSSPIVFNITYIDRPNGIAHIEWDFGMLDVIKIGDIRSLGSNNVENKIKNILIYKCSEKVVFSLSADLGDSGFGQDNWAIKRLYRDRIK